MVFIEASTPAGTGPLGRVAAAERARAHQLAGKRAVERRGHALARHVADGDDEAVRLRREEVVQVAAELVRGRESRGHVHALEPLGQLRRQQRRLHALREADFLLEPDLVGADRLYSRAFSMATAAWLASSVRISTSLFLKASSSGLSRSKTPMQRSFSSSGMTSSDRTSSTTLM